MSTPALLAARHGDQYTAITVHFDGPALLPTLQEHYTDPGKVKALLNLGEIRFLAPHVNQSEAVAIWGSEPILAPTPHVTSDEQKQWIRRDYHAHTYAYHRDGGQDLHPARTYRSLDELCASCEYTYVYDPGTREWSAWHRTPRHIAD